MVGKGIMRMFLILSHFKLAGLSIHFPSLQLKAGNNLTETEVESVDKTIKRLQLNGETCIRGRMVWLRPYLMGKYDLDYLEEKAPFLASELKRQNIADIDHEMWEDFKKLRGG